MESKWLNKQFLASFSNQQILFFLFAFIIAYFSAYLTAWRGLFAVDFPVMVDRTYRIFIGQIPYRDFSSLTPPITYWIQAGLFKLFGLSLNHFKIYLSIQNALFCVLNLYFITHIVQLSLKKTIFLLPLILLWLPAIHFPLPWYDTDPFFFALIGLFVLCFGYQKPTSFIYPAFAGLLAVLSFFSKQNVGMMTFMFSIPFFLFQSCSIQIKLKQIFFYLLGFILMLSIILIYFHFHQALQSLWEWLFVRAYEGQVSSRMGMGKRFYLMFFDFDRPIIKLFGLIYLSAIISSWFLREQLSERVTRKSYLLFCVALYISSHMVGGAISQIGGGFAYQQAFLGIALGLSWKYFETFKVTRKIFPISIFILLVSLFVYTQKITTRWKAFSEDSIHPQLSGIAASPYQNYEINVLLQMDQLIPKDEEVFTTTLPMFYFLTDRHSIPSFLTAYDNGLESKETDFIEVLKKIEKTQVPWAVMSFPPMDKIGSHLPIVKYIFENYETVVSVPGFKSDKKENFSIPEIESYQLFKRKNK